MISAYSTAVAPWSSEQKVFLRRIVIPQLKRASAPMGGGSIGRWFNAA
jgi:hypothetical protein